MALKTSLTAALRHQCFILGLLCGLLLFGCMPQRNVRVYDKQVPPAPLPARKPSEPTTVKPDSAQMLAAEALVDQGRQLLAQGAPDAAIRVLERSVALDSNSGPNYYYLAEAWIMKQNVHQAREFNRLADLHLGRNPEWKARIDRQNDRISTLGH
jgi:tetratricopeptide (TPR) repeat protein